MKKNLYIVAIALILSAFADAQKIEGVAAFMKTGYMNAPNAAKIFNQVYPSGVSGFTGNYFLLGAEGYYRKNSSVFMGVWEFGLQKAYSLNDANADAVYEAVLGKYGRIITEGKNYWLYPSAGAGASVSSLTSYGKVNSRKENMRTQTLVSPTFDVGMNADFLLSKVRWNDKYYLGWIMGIKAGYRVSLKSDKWKDDYNNSYKDDNFYKINEMPAYTNNAFYVTLSVGGGSFDKK
jgi:hypothetical protein